MAIDPALRVPIGRSGLSVSRFGVGTMTLGGFQKAVQDDDARAVVDAAWDAGLRFFDTAPQYGCGLAEVRLGEYLRTRPRHDAVIATKVGKLVVPPGSGGERQALFPGGFDREVVFDFSYDGTMRSIEESLDRLRMDRIDVALIHDVTRYFHGPEGVHERFREAMAGAVRALNRLRDAGTIRAFGTGLKDVDIAQRFAEQADIDCVLVPGRMTLLDQSGLDGLFDYCHRVGVTVLAAAAFDSGILATGAVAGTTYAYQPASEEVLARVRSIESVCTEFGVALQAAALQFPFSHPAVASILVSMRCVAELRQNLAWMQHAIPVDLWRRLGELGLVRLP